MAQKMGNLKYFLTLVLIFGTLVFTIAGLILIKKITITNLDGKNHSSSLIMKYHDQRIFYDPVFIF